MSLSTLEVRACTQNFSQRSGEPKHAKNYENFVNYEIFLEITKKTSANYIKEVIVIAYEELS